jgi:hypothetical protein
VFRQGRDLHYRKTPPRNARRERFDNRSDLAAREPRRWPVFEQGNEIKELGESRLHVSYTDYWLLITDH